jgi:UV DNA damage endonuclease
MDLDIMLEVKDKNISALKCINCVSKRKSRMLEAEWARYKYFVLEKSPESYQAIRQMLKDKSAYPALEMYHLIETVCRMPVEAGNGVNTAQHVWGYFKDKASESEKNRFQKILRKYALGEAGVQPVKSMLRMLAEKYGEDYLLEGYYFYL